MFTGIIEEMGQVRGLLKETNATYIIIEVNKILSDLKNGDSIAVNGVCLTAKEIKSNQIFADISPETSKVTTLSRYQIGKKVNIERAMKIGDRLGGHIVTGHIDDTAVLETKTKENNALNLKFKVSTQIMKYIIKKGSIAIDGISLTIANCEKNFFTISVIPFTLQNTTLNYINSGDIVNVECDIIGKYVENLLLSNNVYNPSLSLKFLKETGFL